MGLAPVINKEKRFRLKTCQCCGQSFGPESYAPTKSIFYSDGALPICNSCIEDKLAEAMLNKDIEKGDSIICKVKNDAIIFSKKDI